MNVRAIVGVLVGVAVLAFALGGYLGGVFTGLGPGPGFTGKGPGDGPTNRDPDRAAASTDQSAELVGFVGDANRMLLVHVDGRSYSIGQVQGDKIDFHSASLDEVVSTAMNRPGSDDGIRVRVTRSKSSKATAEIALRDELVKAGLKAEEIEWENGPPP